MKIRNVANKTKDKTLSKNLHYLLNTKYYFSPIVNRYI